MTPDEQRALLKTERALRKDPAVGAALQTLARQDARGGRPTREPMSPWHPVLWRAESIARVAVILWFVALVVMFLLRAI